MGKQIALQERGGLLGRTMKRTSGARLVNQCHECRSPETWLIHSNLPAVGVCLPPGRVDNKGADGAAGGRAEMRPRDGVLRDI